MGTQNKFQIIKKLTGKTFARVYNGQAIQQDTGLVIPDEHIAKMPKCGLYELSPATCGGSIPSGYDEDHGVIKAEDTPENRDKFQCRIGRRAPMCQSYTANECGRYCLWPVDDRHTSYCTTLELIKLV